MLYSLVRHRYLPLQRSFFRLQIVDLASGFADFALKPHRDFDRDFRFIAFGGHCIALLHQSSLFFHEVGNLRFPLQQGGRAHLGAASKHDSFCGNVLAGESRHR